MISPKRKQPEGGHTVPHKPPTPPTTTTPRGHRNNRTFSKPPPTSREFFAAYYCSEDDEIQNSRIRSSGGGSSYQSSPSGALPPALQVAPNDSLGSPGGRGQRPTPRKCRVSCNNIHNNHEGSPMTSTGSMRGLLKSTVGTGTNLALGVGDRPNSAKWETEQGLVLKRELAQHVKQEREKEAYVRAHSLHRKPQRRLMSKPAPKPPLLGTIAFGSCYSKDSGLSRNDGPNSGADPHVDTGESKHDLPDETVLDHIKFVTTSPRKAARAPESRTVVMYGAASPIDPTSAALQSPRRTSNMLLTHGSSRGTGNTPHLPALTQSQSARGVPPSSSARGAKAAQLPMTSRQIRLNEAECKRKILKPPVTPDLPDSLGEDDLTQLDTFELVHHQMRNIPRIDGSAINLKSPNRNNQNSNSNLLGVTSPHLEETMVPYGPDDSIDEDTKPPARKRDYQLIKAVFRAMMLQDTYPCRMMRSLGGAEVLKRHEEIVQRYGYKRLNRDDFHYQIVEILKIPQHTIDRKDTNMMFDAFDTSLCGYVSEREFEQGIHWVMQGPDERRRIVASYCKHFLSARNVMEAVVSLLEIDMMLNAIVETCEGRFVGVQEDAAGIKARLEPLTRHGTVPFPLFYEAVSKSRLVGRVVRLMQPNGTLPQSFQQSADPDPNREVGTLTVAIDNLQFREGSMFQAHPHSSIGGGGASQDPSKRGAANTTTYTSTSRRTSTTGTISAPSSSHHQGGGDHSGGGSGGGAPKPAGGGLVDLTHPRFKADLSARGPEYRPTPEHDEVKWCLRNGIVWRE